jgi:hypothetical protein
MTFKIFGSTGARGGPYGSLPLAQKHATAMLLSDKRIKAVELRPVSSPNQGGYGPKHVGSFYKLRADVIPE